jgi:hypothetical protein
MGKEWSKYQLAIFDAYENTRKNIVVEATAGAGKSSTLLELNKRTSPGKRVLFMAFNKSIAEELKTKVPEQVEVATFHSKGLKTLLQNVRVRFKISENKCFQIGKKVLDLDDIEGGSKKQAKYLFELQVIWNFLRQMLSIDYRNDIPPICWEKDIEFRERMIEDITLIEAEWRKQLKKISIVSEFIMDFTDMLWIPYMMIPSENFPKYGVVFTDEAQDSNILQREMILNYIKPGGRFITVGDPYQCQPEGTKILMSDGTKKNIEDVQIGESVVSYEYRHDNCFVGNYERIKKKSLQQYKKLCENSKSKILKIAQREYDDILYKVTTGDFTSKYTPEHICYVRWKPSIKNKFALYLMQKGDWFRIGITPYVTGAKRSGGLLFRFYCEEADRLWLLNLYDDKSQARLDELYYSYKFGIPQTIFNCRKEKDVMFGQEGLNTFFNRFNGELKQNAINLLKVFDRKIECPFLKKEKEDSRWKTGISYMFNTYACNIFPELMQVIIYDGFNYNKASQCSRAKPIYKDIENWEKISYKGKVFSLEVGWNQNYVADGILTHNCIYSFMGSTVEIFESYKRMENTITLPLSISYRCDKAIVAEAKKTFADKIEASPFAQEGVVRNGELKEAQEGDFVLCRNNIPLVAAFIIFLELKKKATIKGKDFGENLLLILDKINEIKDLDVLLLEKKKSLMEKGIPEAVAINHPSYALLEEKCMILRLLFKRWPSIFELRNRISEIFVDETEGIVLSTIHKSKGLEADRVFFLNQNLIPSPKATSEKALYSEKCLRFVAVTRARHELVYCTI